MLTSSRSRLRLSLCKATFNSSIINFPTTWTWTLTVGTNKSDLSARTYVCYAHGMGNVRICQFMHSIFRYFYDI